MAGQGQQIVNMDYCLSLCRRNLLRHILNAFSLSSVDHNIGPLIFEELEFSPGDNIPLDPPAPEAIVDPVDDDDFAEDDDVDDDGGGGDEAIADNQVQAGVGEEHVGNGKRAINENGNSNAKRPKIN